MTDPLATSVATALVTGATTALSDGVRAAVTKLAQLIRKRLRRNSPQQDALEAALESPRDAEAVERLAQVIEQQMFQDPAFAEQLRQLEAPRVVRRLGFVGHAASVRLVL